MGYEWVLKKIKNQVCNKQNIKTPNTYKVDSRIYTHIKCRPTSATMPRLTAEYARSLFTRLGSEADKQVTVLNEPC